MFGEQAIVPCTIFAIMDILWQFNAQTDRNMIKDQNNYYTKKKFDSIENEPDNC